MPLITKGKSNYIYTLIAIIVAALTVCGILIYIENYNNELYLLNQSVGMKKVEKSQENNIWKNYKNIEYGYEISYPPNFLVHEPSLNLTSFYPEDSRPIVNIEITQNSEKLSLDQWFEQYKKQQEQIGIILYKEENTSIDEIPAIKFFNGYDHPTNFQVVNACAIKWSWIYCINEEFTENSLLDQILSTFKFISTSTDETAEAELKIFKAIFPNGITNTDLDQITSINERANLYFSKAQVGPSGWAQDDWKSVVTGQIKYYLGQDAAEDNKQLFLVNSETMKDCINPETGNSDTWCAGSLKTAYFLSWDGKEWQLKGTFDLGGVVVASSGKN